MKLTAAERRALEATRDGKVTRVYKDNGNILRGPKGMSARTLWELDRRKLIEDSQDETGNGHARVYVRQMLTDAGREAIAIVAANNGGE